MEGAVEAAVALLRNLNYEVRGPGEIVDSAAAESESEVGDASIILTPAGSEVDGDEFGEMMTPAHSEIDADEQAGDGDRTPRASPTASVAGSEILSADFGNLALPAAAYEPAGTDRTAEREEYDLPHGSIDADRLWPKDGEQVLAESVVEEDEEDGELMVIEKKKEEEGSEGSEAVSGGAVSMSEAALKTVCLLLPLVVVMGSAGSEAESVGSGGGLRGLLDQYLTNIGTVAAWLDEVGTPVMQAQGMEEVGGLQGMIARSRAVALYAGFAVPDELIGALHGSVLILKSLEEEAKEMLEMVDSGLKQHRAILNALRSCVKDLS